MIKEKMSVILIDNVSLKIKSSTIINQISLKLEKGKIYGFEGTNGSGKTMLFRLICGLVKPTSGKIEIKTEGNGLPIGAIIESPGFILEHSGFENLKLLAMIRNDISEEVIKQTMELIGLDPKDKRNVKSYSLGMRQKLGLAQAFMEAPKILVLDEPMNGLDKRSVENLKKIIMNYAKNGTTILISSHNRQDLDTLCNEIFLIENGCIVKENLHIGASKAPL
jgi:ABC-2 type transport system ATP-binding protein